MGWNEESNSPIGDHLVISWFIPLPNDGWLVRVFLHMAVQAVLLEWEGESIIL